MKLPSHCCILLEIFWLGISTRFWVLCIFWASRRSRLSPRMRRASSRSFFMRVTRLAWIAQRCASSKRPVTKASVDSYKAIIAYDWNRKFESMFEVIWRTRRWNGARGSKSWVDLWYFRTSRRATIPGLNRGFFGAALFLGCCVSVAVEWGRLVSISWDRPGSLEFYLVSGRCSTCFLEAIFWRGIESVKTDWLNWKLNYRK